MPAPTRVLEVIQRNGSDFLLYDTHSVDGFGSGPGAARDALERNLAELRSWGYEIVVDREPTEAKFKGPGKSRSYRYGYGEFVPIRKVAD